MAEPQPSFNELSPPPAQELDRLGKTLRRAFDEVATEPLPEAFEDLLRQLR